MKKYFTLPAFFLLTLFFITGCAGAAPTPDQLATIVATTLTAVAVNIPPPTATAVAATATSSPVPATSAPEAAAGTRYIFTTAENVNLRVNPGTQFKVSRVLSKGTRLQVLGAAPGRRWLNVVNDEGIIGWVGVDFVTGGFDGPPPPLVNPSTDAQLVTGKVVDVTGKPIDGLVFAVTQNTLREDTVTDADGTFYVYLPLKFSGAWNVEVVGIDCKSTIVDANCQCLGGACKADPAIATVMLPLSEPLNFVWR